MADEQWIAEEVIAKKLGLDRDRARDLRPTSAKKIGREIYWPRADAESVANGLKLSLAEASATPPGEPESAERGEELTVVSSPGVDGFHFTNRHLIRCARAEGELVVVRVVSSQKYTPRLQDGQPMRLRAEKAPEGNWWILVGREPRWKGKL